MLLTTCAAKNTSRVMDFPMKTLRPIVEYDNIEVDSLESYDDRDIPEVGNVYFI